MTWFSLKRTLQFNLASSIEVLNPINQDVARSNLHTPLRYSTVLLSIGKTTQICHQNIPLKKINCNGTVTYISAISRKLANRWHCPSHDIAEMLLSVLQEQISQPVWSSLQRQDDWLEFVISQQGIERWQQQLDQWVLIPQGEPWPIEPAQLWELQSGYELCCRWQRYCSMGSPHLPASVGASAAPFLMPDTAPLQDLIHCLLEICDRWHQSSSPQLLQQLQRLVWALQKWAAMTRLSPEIRPMDGWLEPTRIVLQQSLQGRLGHQLVDRF